MNDIPDLTIDGLLPEGVHACTMTEVQDRFGKFQRSERRIKLTNALGQYLAALRATGFVRRVIVDGSYVSSKEEPGDIDLIVVLDAACDFASEVRPADYNAVSRRQVRRRYGFDVMVVPEDSEALAEKFSFFQQDRGGRRKGLLEVQP